MGLLDMIAAAYPSPLNAAPTGDAYPGSFDLPGFLNMPFGAGATPFVPVPDRPQPSPPAAPLPTAPASVTYPSPISQPDLSAPNAAAYGSLGVDPTALLPSRFDMGAPPSKPAGPAPTGFGAGAAPFSFAGPGSNVVSPSDIAAPAPVPVPAPRPAAASAPPAPPPAAAPPAAPVVAADDEEEAPAARPAAASPGAPAAPATAPFSLGGNINAALTSIQNSKGLIPRLLNGATALATGQRTDVAGQATTATAQALLSKGAPLADVQAAAVNPTLMQALINQYYGKEKYSVVQTGESDNGKTFSIFNTNDGTLKPIGGVGNDASERGGTVAGPDGKPIQIPPGVNRKEFIKRVTEANADAATGKVTEAQAKSAQFAARMESAERVLGPLQNEGLSLFGKGAESLPGGLGNYAQSPNYQKYQQAKASFIMGVARAESGANVTPSEFDKYSREFFPQPGDGPEVVKQKAQMRAVAIEEMRHSAGPGYKSPAAGLSGKTANGIPWSVQ
jgi:hypothetical protein